MSLSTHVLDTTSGLPASGVALRLDRRDGDRWVELADATTDTDGRVGDLAETLEPGVHRVVFETGAWWRLQDVTGFFPEVAVVFEVTEPAQHHHVPLLLSPHGYTTYRGS